MLIGVLGNRSYLFNEITAEFPHLAVDFLSEHNEISEKHKIVICIGYYKIIPKEDFDKPELGTFVLHGSNLPEGRGWSPVNWALIHNDSHLFVTSFKVDDGCDTGLIYMKTKCDLEITDSLSTAFNKIENMCIEHLRCICNDISNKRSINLYQQAGSTSWNNRRSKADSELDISKSLSELWPLIRSCDNDKYPAFFKLNGKKVILRYEIL